MLVSSPVDQYQIGVVGRGYKVLLQGWGGRCEMKGTFLPGAYNFINLTLYSVAAAKDKRMLHTKPITCSCFQTICNLCWQCVLTYYMYSIFIDICFNINWGSFRVEYFICSNEFNAVFPRLIPIKITLQQWSSLRVASLTTHCCVSVELQTTSR